MRAVFTRQSVINLISYTFLALHSVAYDQVLPVFLNYPEHPGDNNGSQPPTHDAGPLSFLFFSRGFGLDSGRIGTIFTLYGVVCGLIQFLVYPWLCARFGVLRCFRGSALAFPLAYLLTPYTALVGSPGSPARYAALVAVMCAKAFAVIVGFPSTTILLTNSAASLEVLGTLNGFATTFSALGRALGPALAGAAFSFGVRRDFIALPWWLLATVAAIGAVPVWFIEEGEGPSGRGRRGGSADAEEDEDTSGGEDNEDADDEATEVEEDEDETSLIYLDPTPDSNTAIIAGDALDAAGVPEDQIAPEPRPQGYGTLATPRQ